jgi:hypothetical protein
MPPITHDEQVDELKQRRTARGSRSPRKSEAPPRSSSAEPARDLLGGLITNGAPEVEQPVVDGPPDAAHATPAPARETAPPPDRPTSQEVTETDVGGEKIDELIRRVKEGTPADADETMPQRRRPKGTADLSPSAMPRRSQRRTRHTVRSRRRPSSSRRALLIGCVATMAAVGISFLVVSLSGNSGRPRPVGSVVRSTPTTESSAAFGSDLTRSIAALGPELGRIARRAATATHTTRTRHKVARRHPSRRRPKTARHIRRSAQQPIVTASASPQTVTTVQSQTYTSASPPVVAPSQTAVSATHSTTSSTRSSGPTGSSPLGGIGSCVKGC